MHCLLALLKRKGRKNSLKDDVATVERLDTRQQTVLTRKARKKRSQRTNPTKKRHKNLKRIVRERERPIRQKLNVIIAVKWVILLGTARSHAKMLILVEKVSKTENSAN